MSLIDDIIKHSRNRDYMSGIERDQARIKATSEVFTPTTLVQKLLESFIDPTNIADNFLDPSCGDGQILSEILIQKVKSGMTFEQALSTIYGVDLMQDNVELCRERLLCGREDLRHIVEQNIVCADALRYHYRFDGSHPHDDEVREQKQEELYKNLFEE
jgi:type I restriction-modification system DNA methylase subunit